MQPGSNTANTMTAAGVRVEVIPPDRWWHSTRYRLLEPVTACGHTVPAGFITDGATVPRFLSVVAGLLVLLSYAWGWTAGIGVGVLVAVAVVYFPPVGRYLVAAIIHDWLLEHHPRAYADREFRRVIVWLRIASWRRWVMYLAVRGYSAMRPDRARSPARPPAPRG